MKSEWDSNTGLPKDKQKTKRLLFTETKSTIPERESLKSEWDSNTEQFFKKKRGHQDIKLEITVNK